MSRLEQALTSPRSLCTFFEKSRTSCTGCHWIDSMYNCQAPAVFALSQQELNALGDSLCLG